MTAVDLPSRRRFRDPGDYDRLRPDGRWARLLIALDKGPADASDLLEATDQGRYPLWRERRKIRTALFDMADLGWVEATHWGWIRTAAGTDALDSLPNNPGDRRCAAP